MLPFAAFRAASQRGLPTVQHLLRTAECGVVSTSGRPSPETGASCGWGTPGRTALQINCFGSSSDEIASKWEWMQQQGHKINPCNSKLHPAVTEAGIAPASGPEMAVQEAYTPDSACFGCGPRHPDGLHVRSKRISNGLEARLAIDPKYCAFPGIVNGGILSTVMDCHGNWTAAIALMDRSALPKPPLTLTASMFVQFKEPTPPGVELLVRSQVVNIKEGSQPGMGKVTVEVDVSLFREEPDGSERLLVTGTGIFKRLGALRAL